MLRSGIWFVKVERFPWMSKSRSSDLIYSSVGDFTYLYIYLHLWNWQTPPGILVVWDRNGGRGKMQGWLAHCLCPKGVWRSQHPWSPYPRFRAQTPLEWIKRTRPSATFATLPDKSERAQQSGIQQDLPNGESAHRVDHCWGGIMDCRWLQRHVNADCKGYDLNLCSNPVVKLSKM